MKFWQRKIENVQYEEAFVYEAKKCVCPVDPVAGNDSVRARGGKSRGSIRCRVLSDSDNHAHFIRSKREILLFRSEPVLESGKAGAGF